MTTNLTSSTDSLPSRVRDAVLTTMRKARITGLALAVTDRHRIRHAAGFGLADLTTRSPVTPSTAFMWFSMSKIVTATAALSLADDGLLDLDAPVTAYLPEVRSRWPEVGSRWPAPSVRQLLNHTSGLANPMPLRWVHPASEPGPDPDHLLRRQLARRRSFRRPPGNAVRYSNLGYLALGQIIQTAARMPFADYVREAVLAPAGMHHTGYEYGDAPAAVGYVRVPAGIAPLLRLVLPDGITGPRTDGKLALAPFYVDGPAYGGVVGDVLDAARFVRLHLGDGAIDGHRVLRVDTVQRMRGADRPGRPFEHGLGWFRTPTTTGRSSVQHFGGGAGFRNVMRIYPRDGVGVVVMTNTTAAYPTEPLLDQLAGV